MAVRKAFNVNEFTSVNELESKFVHDVYRDIAPHFSDTRHKPWPKVADFLTRLPHGSLVADIGMCETILMRNLLPKP